MDTSGAAVPTSAGSSGSRQIEASRSLRMFPRVPTTSGTGILVRRSGARPSKKFARCNLSDPNP